VPGHAVMRLSELSQAETSDSAWYLLSYQRDMGFHDIITSHIKAGIDIANEDKLNSVLIFSGGETRKDVGPTSEAASYYYLAQYKNWIDDTNSDNIFIEEYARDSFENLLFSICRYREIKGYYPNKISVVGFDFKAERFSSLHRSALKFPASQFHYFGLRPNDDRFDHLKASEGERGVARVFSEDPYGCHDAALQHKRIARNPFKRTVPYELACPEIKELLKWCGPGIFNKRKLPWEL